MKKILLILFLTSSIFGEVLVFSGSYQSVNLNSGCLYSGLLNNKKIKVYTNETCLTSLTSKKIIDIEEIKREFYCVVDSGSFFDSYLMYKGKCEINYKL